MCIDLKKEIVVQFICRCHRKTFTICKYSCLYHLPFYEGNCRHQWCMSHRLPITISMSQPIFSTVLAVATHFATCVSHVQLVSLLQALLFRPCLLQAGASVPTKLKVCCMVVASATHTPSDQFQLQLGSSLQNLLLLLPEQLLPPLLLLPSLLGTASVMATITLFPEVEVEDEPNVKGTPQAFIATHVSRVKCTRQHSSGLSNRRLVLSLGSSQALG